MRHVALVVLVILPGLLAVIASGYYLTVDWPALQASRGRCDQAVTRHADTSELFAAHAKEEAHRFNVFAEGVWLLLGAILAGVGIHGLCLLPRGRRHAPKVSPTAAPTASRSCAWRRARSRGLGRRLRG
jgi:hypothetical protein